MLYGFSLVWVFEKRHSSETGTGTSFVAFWGPRSTRPAQIIFWPYVSCACVPDPNCSIPSSVKDARRSVTGPLSAASARYLQMGDSDLFGR